MGINFNFGYGGGLTPGELHSVVEYSDVQGRSIADIANFLTNLINERNPEALK